MTSLIGRLFSGLPTAVVLVALAALGYWGHRTGWKAPAFSQLWGRAAAETQEDWCAEHNVPESRCIKCHPELAGANAADWCREHGVPESRCTACHPEILTTGVAGDWCREHGLPESSCTLCHPEIAAKGPPPASQGAAQVSHAHSHAATRPAPPAPDPRTCQTHALRVQFASADAVRKAGVKLAQVAHRPMSATLSANAEVQYDRTRLAQVSSPVAGKVWRVEKEVGQQVKQGEVIALIDAAEVGRAKAELLAALADQDLKTRTLKRLKTSAESGLRTGLELEEAEAAAKAAGVRIFNAQQALVNLGLPAHEPGPLQPQDVQLLGLPKSLAQKLDPRLTTANLLPLTAPLDGTVIERNAVPGEIIEPSRPLLVVADTSRMWMVADVPLSESRRVVIGQDVTFRHDGSPDEAATGKVAWISTAVDEQTRTVKVRADVENPDGRLLARTFGRARITIRQSAAAVAIPTEAIQWEGCCHITFVRHADDLFQARKVKLGAKVNGFTEVLIGLLPGEVVVAEGSHVLKSEILKSALGAGCGEH